MDTSSKQRINKDTQILNETLNQMNLIDIFMTFHDIFMTFHPNAEEYTFFSSAHGTFSRTDHILGHRSSLSKFKKIEIVSSIFTDHNNMKLVINYRKKKKKLQKNTDSWRLKNILLNNKKVTEEIRKVIKIFLETNDNENTMTQNLRDSAKAVLRGKFIVIIPQETRKALNRQLKSTSKAAGKKKKKKNNNNNKKPKVRRRKEIIKIREEINEKKRKKKLRKQSQRLIKIKQRF